MPIEILYLLLGVTVTWSAIAYIVEMIRDKKI